MTAARAGRAIGAALLLAAGGCSQSSLTIPEAPLAIDTAQLAASYDMPTAIIDGTNIQQAFTDAQARLDALQLGWLPAVVVDLLSRVKARLQDAGLPDRTGKFTARGAPVNAVLQVEHVCNGWADPGGPPDKNANGSLNAVAVVEDGKLSPRLWAEASQCQASVAPDGSALASALSSVQASLDGTLIFYLMGALPTSTSDANLLVALQATAGVAGHVGSTSFDFELTPSGVRFQVAAGGGQATVTVGIMALQFAGANATFSCDVATASCTQIQ
ncbi:MAG TPA: hypothetical protein VHO67_18305 [Polyangia bacterium]|nr:hypothetical protein [Polyangia bacterium]